VDGNSLGRQCVCRDPDVTDMLDHARLWRTPDGGYMLTGEPYGYDRRNIDRFHRVMEALGLKVETSAESPWYPGSTTLIMITRAVPKPVAEPALPSLPVMRVDIDKLLKKRFGAQPENKKGTERRWRIDSPTGGYFTVEVTLKPRWCSIAVDRWNTTDRAKEPADTWFRGNVWPHIKWGSLPGGGGCYTSAFRLERSMVSSILSAWVEQELTWGIPRGNGLPS
jgi:hypothetical protein